MRKNRITILNTIIGICALFLYNRGMAGSPRWTQDRFSSTSSSETPDGVIDRQQAYYAFIPYFYDVEGHSGINYYCCGHSGFTSRYGLASGLIKHNDYTLNPALPASQAGIPFWWEINTPYTGIVRGWTTTCLIDSAESFIIPIRGSELGLTYEVRGGLAQNLAVFTIYTALADSVTSPSPVVMYEAARLGIPSSLTAVYLPGNSLSDSIGIETHYFGAHDLEFDGGMAGLWGFIDDPPFSSEAYFPHAIPSGDTIIAAQFDGMTEAITNVSLEGGYELIGTLPFAPLPDSGIPNATETYNFGDPPDWIIVSTLNAVLLEDSVDLTTDLDRACDRNGDGILDIADKFYFSQEVR